jgi:hypothetical protein
LANLVEEVVFFASLPQDVEMAEDELGRVWQALAGTDWRLVPFPLVRTSAALKPQEKRL